MQLTKTTTRAFAASLALVAAGGTIAGAAVFHLPILGLGRADAASAKVAPTAPKAAPVAHKAHRKVIVKTRYADVIVHVPAPSVSGAAGALSAPPSAARSLQSVPSSAPYNPGPRVSEPVFTTTTTSGSTTPTVGSYHDDGEHGDSHESQDAPEAPEHQGATTTTTTVQP